jgi:hypothetical protein
MQLAPRFVRSASPPSRPIGFILANANCRRLASTIYEQRSFDLMPALGTALSDAGCTDPVILGHCASKNHWPGCWLTDLLLKKE